MPDPTLLEKPAYPVIFIVILSLVFVGALAAMYRLNEAKIDRQRQEAYERSILSLCADSIAAFSGETAQQIMDDYPISFGIHIKELPSNAYPRKAFEVKAGDRSIGFVFDITGKGLWGTMRALLATTSDKRRIIGIGIYEQMETPGLGARIEESWFSGQFRGKTIISDGKPAVMSLIPEEQEPTDARQINQVTGATITSNAVLQMLQTEMGIIMNNGKDMP